MVPESSRLEIGGKLAPRVMGKDVILKITDDFGADVAMYKSVEFVRPAVAEMSLSDRWATRFGFSAVELIAEGRYVHMVDRTPTGIDPILFTDLSTRFARSRLMASWCACSVR